MVFFPNLTTNFTTFFKAHLKTNYLRPVPSTPGESQGKGKEALDSLRKVRAYIPQIFGSPLGPLFPESWLSPGVPATGPNYFVSLYMRPRE